MIFNGNTKIHSCIMAKAIAPSASGKYVNDWKVSGHIMYKLPRGVGSLIHRS